LLSNFDFGEKTNITDSGILDNPLVNLMAILLKHLIFSSHNNFFTTHMLICVMNLKNFHDVIYGEKYIDFIWS